MDNENMNNLAPQQGNTEAVEQQAAQPESAAQENNASAQAPEYSSEKVVATASREDGATRFALYEDPETGKRYLRTEVEPEKQTEPGVPAAENEQEKTPEAQQYNEQTQTGQQEPAPEKNEENVLEEQYQTQPYDLDEFSMAIASGNVDESRVPEEFKQQYGNFRLNQAMQEFTRRQQMAQEQARQQVQKQLSPEEVSAARKEFYRQVDADAKEMALKDLGMTAEQYDEAQYDDKADENLNKDYETAYNWHRNELMNRVQQMAQSKANYQNHQRSVYQTIVNFRDAQRAQEKNFDTIDNIMTKRYLSMPYEKGKTISEAITALKNGTITPNQAVTIQKYYEDTRKEFYAKKAGLSRSAPKAAPVQKAPPVVEGSGSGKENPDGPKYTVKDLHDASRLKDRMNIFAALLAEKRRNH